MILRAYKAPSSWVPALKECKNQRLKIKIVESPQSGDDFLNFAF